MKPADFAILMICCAAWAGNFVVSAWTVGHNPVPPFMLAATRASIVLLLMGWVLLRGVPPNLLRLSIVCACVGPIHLGFLYTGLQTAPASASAIISQLLIPFATILSLIFLREKVGWVRGLGIVGAFIGTIVMVYEPGALTVDNGLMCILGAYVALAIGSVLMKTVGDVDWKQYVALTALMMFVLMTFATLMFETGHAQVWGTSKWPLLIAAVYAGAFVSIVAHGQYFRLIQDYPVTLIVPLTLMVPLLTAILGVTFLDEVLTRRVIIGATLILPCVFIIAKRQNLAPVQED